MATSGFLPSPRSRVAFRPVLADDTEVIIVEPFGPVRGLSIPHGAAAPVHDRVNRDFQADRAIDDALFASVMLPPGGQADDHIPGRLLL